MTINRNSSEHLPAKLHGVTGGTGLRRDPELQPRNLPGELSSATARQRGKLQVFLEQAQLATVNSLLLLRNHNTVCPAGVLRARGRVHPGAGQDTHHPTGTTEAATDRHSCLQAQIPSPTWPHLLQSAGLGHPWHNFGELSGLLIFKKAAGRAAPPQLSGSALILLRLPQVQAG